MYSHWLILVGYISARDMFCIILFLSDSSQEPSPEDYYNAMQETPEDEAYIKVKQTLATLSGYTKDGNCFFHPPFLFLSALSPFPTQELWCGMPLSLLFFFFLLSISFSFINGMLCLCHLQLQLNPNVQLLLIYFFFLPSILHKGYISSWLVYIQNCSQIYIHLQH